MSKIEIHWSNPFNVIPVPVEELAECLSGGMIGTDTGSVPHDKKFIMSRWLGKGDKLDAYLLPDRGSGISAGVRWGDDGPDYFSPHVKDQEKAAALLAKYIIEKDEIPAFKG